jgi:hypothetical protein
MALMSTAVPRMEPGQWCLALSLTLLGHRQELAGYVKPQEERWTVNSRILDLSGRFSCKAPNVDHSICLHEESGVLPFKILDCLLTSVKSLFKCYVS